MKECRDCGVTKSINEFYAEKRNSDGKDSFCRDCRKVRHYAWVEKNRKHVNAYNVARYASSEKERNVKIAAARRRAGVQRAVSSNTVTSKDIQRIKSSACVACGSTENIEIDHVIPISRGGLHSVGNLQPLCMRCNRSKLNKFFAEFRYRTLLRKVA